MGSLIVHTQISVGLPLFAKRGVVKMVLLSNQEESQQSVDGGTPQFNWAIWRERNRVVFEDVVFSPNRMKLSFVSALISWARLIPNMECSLARILLCIL